MRISHPDLPFELEHIGQEVICHYPEGATAIVSRAEWMAGLLLQKLDQLIEHRDSVKITEGPVLEKVLDVVNKEVDTLVSPKEK
jgi:hypothetical protein